MLHTCIQVFHVVSVCFRGMFKESWGHGPDTASQGPTDGVCGASGVLRTGHARPRPDSQVPSTRRERRGSGRSGGRGTGRDGQGRGTCAWRDEADRERLQRYGGSPAHFLLGRLVPSDRTLSHLQLQVILKASRPRELVSAIDDNALLP
jgi:hypothetical protein